MEDLKNYHVAIAEHASFHGRQSLVAKFASSPWQLRLLLGGQGIGKTSLLYRLAHELVHQADVRLRFLPVYLEFRRETPSDTDAMLGQLLHPVELAADPSCAHPHCTDGFQSPTWTRQAMLQSPAHPVIRRDFERRLAIALEQLQKKGFSGVVYLLDDCEPLIEHEWFCQDTSGFLRASLVESPIHRTRVGFIFTGYRDLHHHRQKIGSPLVELAETEWLDPLSHDEVQGLVRERIKDGDLAQAAKAIFEYGGGHPFLTQRLISECIHGPDVIHASGSPSMPELAERCCLKVSPSMDRWWGDGNERSSGFTPQEKTTYLAFLQSERLTPRQAADRTGLAEVECREAIMCLVSGGVVQSTELGVFRAGARMFSDRVRQLSSRSPMERPMKPDEATSHVVISIHGIRTRGEWQKDFTSELGHDLIHAPFDYGFFSLIDLIIPSRRARRIEDFLDRYTRLCEKHRIDRPSIVAHSFGTYIVANALMKYEEIKFDRMIFCGSIVPPDFAWSQLDGGRFSRLLNEYGHRDVWVRLVEWIVEDAGPSGGRGFSDTAADRVIQRKRPEFRHSDYFYALNYKKSWVPFLKGDDPVSAETVHARRRNWRFAFVKLLLLLAVLCAVAVYVYSRHRASA